MTTTRWITCNACGADDFRELGRVADWRIGRCGRCSLVYVNPTPFFEPSHEFSTMSLEFQYTRFQREVTPEVLGHDARQFQRQCGEIERITGRPLRPGAFLDLGCGSGSTVHAAAQAGWEAVGIDIDPALVEMGRRQLGVDVRCGTLPDPALPGDHYAFIRLRDVIEHLPNPREVLVEVRRLLAPGGVVLIATPNEGSLPTRARALVGVKKTEVATVVPPHHLHGFDPSTLRRILDAAGLATLDVATSTPLNPTYVTARNMKEAHGVRVPIWMAAQAMGMGSMLVGWATRA